MPLCVCVIPYKLLFKPQWIRNPWPPPSHVPMHSPLLQLPRGLLHTAAGSTAPQSPAPGQHPASPTATPAKRELLTACITAACVFERVMLKYKLPVLGDFNVFFCSYSRGFGVCPWKEPCSSSRSPTSIASQANVTCSLMTKVEKKR